MLPSPRVRPLFVGCLVSAAALGGEPAQASFGRAQVTANMFGELVARQLGGEVGASFWPVRFLGIGAAAVLGRHVGGRLTLDLNPNLFSSWLRPLLQLRGIVHPVPGAVAFGAGAFLGASAELGPGRVLLGVMGELFAGPTGYYPYAVYVAGGYRLDLFRAASPQLPAAEPAVDPRPPEPAVEPRQPAPPPVDAAVRGRVVGKVGENPRAPLAGVTVQSGERSVTSGPDGTFRLAPVGPGPVELSLSAPGYRAAREHIWVPEGAEVSADLYLERQDAPARIRGVVRSVRGDPIAARLMVTATGVSTLADEAGRFELEVGPGRSTLVIEAAGHLKQSRTVDLVEGDLMIIYFNLTPLDR